MIESVANKHKDCQLAIRWKLFKGRTTPTPGLFCSCHDALLDWIPDDLAYELIDIHKIPIQVYTPRPTKDQRKAKAKAMKMA